MIYSRIGKKGHIFFARIVSLALLRKNANSAKNLETFAAAQENVDRLSTRQENLEISCGVAILVFGGGRRRRH